MNFLGREEDVSDERERARFRVAVCRDEILDRGREREERIEDVVVSIEERVWRKTRRGEESEWFVDRHRA